MRRKLVALGAMAVFAGGCTPWEQYRQNGWKVGPNYATPPAAVAADWIDSTDERLRKDADDLSRWWTCLLYTSPSPRD